MADPVEGLRDYPHFVERWKKVSHSPARSLLQRALLRELAHHLHAEKSRIFATGSRDKADFLKKTELTIQRFRDAVLPNRELEGVLSDDSIQISKPPKLPAHILKAVPLEKWTRYDRHWEHRLADEALKLGWDLLLIRADVLPERAESFHHQLSDRLWPHAIVLFVESASQKLEDMRSGIWSGVWILVAESGFAISEQDFLEIRQITRLSETMTLQSG